MQSEMFDGHLTRDHFTALGRVAYFAGVIERLMGDLAVEILATDAGKSSAVIAGLPFAALTDLVARLSPALSADKEHSVLRSLPELRSAMEERNVLLHGFWNPFPDYLQPSIELRRRKALVIRPRVSADEVNKAADELERVSTNLFFTLLFVSDELDEYSDPNTH